jgi:hypothetical protein
MRSKDLTELVFEGLSESTALQLAQEVLGRAVVLPTADEGVVDVGLPRLEVDERTALQKVRVRILRYDDQFDVEVNFVPRDTESASPEAMMDSLHRYAMRLSQRHHIGSYYAGIEPASDKETRFFTGTVRVGGPIGDSRRDPDRG